MEEDWHESFESNTPHFFKIILHDTLQSGKLGFPKSFIRKHGSGLCSNKVYLKITSGDVWEVALYEENGDIWLHDGWREFVEFYRIKFGYFLVFGYQGNSEFQVLIFDKSTSEIKYPVKPCNKSKQKDGVYPCLLPVKHEIEISDSEMLVDHNACQINANKNIDFLEKGSGTGDDGGKNGGLRTFKCSSPQKAGKKAEASFKTRDFDSPNQYIRLLMQSNRVKSCILHLPGGKPFAKDNNLIVGDVCVFELVDNVEFRFQVSILRAAEDRNPGLYPGTSAKTLSAPTRNHIARIPSFKLMMTESQVKRKSAYLPSGLVKHLNERTQVATLEVAGRFWCVSANYYPLTKKGTFANGWDTFVMDNSLRIGDVCELELINMEPMVVKVTIRRCSA